MYTKFSQMKALKDNYILLWNDWMINAPKSFTSSNNIRSPGYALVIEWISKIWTNFSRDTLRNSFAQCGIVTSDPRLFHNQLRHFVKTRTLIDDIETAEEQIFEFHAFEREAAEELMEGEDEVLGHDSDDIIESDEE